MKQIYGILRLITINSNPNFILKKEKRKDQLTLQVDFLFLINKPSKITCNISVYEKVSPQHMLFAVVHVNDMKLMT